MHDNLEENRPPFDRRERSSDATIELDRSQKIALVFLGILSIAVVALWFTQAKKNLSGTVNEKEKSEKTEECIDGSCNTMDDLRGKDTDHDGLNDYDELNLYNTSPYLEDSDSDGYSDQQEISTQNDPNCPFGQVCNVEPVPTDTIDPEDYGAEAKTEAFGDDIDAATIRKMLLESGMEQEVLDQFSDDDLMASFKDVLSEDQAVSQ